MKDMLKQIIAMDEQAQALTKATEKERLRAEQQIVVLKEKKHEEYLRKARESVKKNEIVELKKAEQNLLEAKDKHKNALDRMNKNFKENAGKWIDEIVSRVLSA